MQIFHLLSLCEFWLLIRFLFYNFAFKIYAFMYVEEAQFGLIWYFNFLFLEYYMHKVLEFYMHLFWTKLIPIISEKFSVIMLSLLHYYHIHYLIKSKYYFPSLYIRNAIGKYTIFIWNHKTFYTSHIMSEFKIRAY